MNRACLAKSSNLHEQKQHASSLSTVQSGIQPIKNNFVRLKKYILITCGFFCLNIALHGQELLAESKKLGFVSYLTTVKSISEFKMISLAWDERYRTDQDNVPRFQSKYNLLRLAVDRLINQLSADMLLSNKVKVYRKINNFIKLKRSGLPGHLSNYSDLIKEIDSRLEPFMSETYYDEKAGISVDEIAGVAELVHGVITDARDFREKKVANLCLMLKDLKLQSLVDLTESKEE